MIPILVRTRNRPQLLSMTIASLLATAPREAIEIVDDGSDDPTTKLWYAHAETIQLPAYPWPRDPDWRKYTGALPALTRCPPVDLPLYLHERLGVIGGHMGYSLQHAERHPDAEWLVMLEDDLAMAAGWYEHLSDFLANVDDDVGFVTLYDRHDGLCPIVAREALHRLALEQQPPNRKRPSTLAKKLRPGQMKRLRAAARSQLDVRKRNNIARGWREITLRQDCSSWGYGTAPLAGGCAYVLRRSVIEQGEAFQAQYHPDHTAGDAMIQITVARQGYRCLALCPSWCQHLGVASEAHPGRHLRYVSELAGPLVYG